ncbi:peptidoglycan editing factor PgeF [Phyllobacterium lublinensis]|uniref:peptidoglycan editing factor PgeF n=1 Tax=Phyllobacterium lublinensis TaxID=2875708 RepID=UPI001CCBBC9E|nr:peptidoglycan editing factor PgeF [Phyllobacterium sp. 2063]MBZ9655390.1 peptidoglycan editing factor PgeF [Phyllobacterium sp. 2063]
MITSDKPVPLHSSLLGSPETNRIAHGFFTRHGGVSDGIYRGLNVGSGSNDNQDHVKENRRRVAESLGAPLSHLVTVHQVHSPDVVTVTAPFAGARPDADAIVTATPGIVVGALSADCGPILFADNEAKVVGAAHAGWKGAIGGVLENTVDAMIALGARRDRIQAVLGPTIGPDNYEVGGEFYNQFVGTDPAYKDYFRDSVKDGHKMFDLWAFIITRLERAGVNASSLERCTYADEDQFFSYRRTTHRKEPDYGRQISAITIME